MHIPWGFFARGLTDRTPAVSWRHTFTQTMYEPYLARSGVRIFLAAAMAAEAATSPAQARRLILDQLAFVEAFAAAHSDRYAVARTPEEARTILATTDKMVIVHSIEGGHLLLADEADARFWADAGVALVTLVHLRDDELGGSALLPDFKGPLINPVGTRSKRRGERRGLTERGKAAIVELADAGILVDFSHMSHDTVEDALAVTGAHGIAPVITHGSLSSIRDSDFAITEAQLVEIYRQGGIFALGLSAEKLIPLNPTVDVPEHCVGTLDTFALHYERANTVVQGNAAALLGVPWEEASSSQRTALSVGWSSDWNGWLAHSRPKHGPGRCLPNREDPLEIDTLGLAHPGLLPQHWQRLEEAEVDLDPMLRSAERFLQLWAQARR
ncbi:MAG: membrane dipeptidase [Pseudomonadota bacterium]|nr:membrane dipeptidase [Pseudomonadota bacterium]